MELKDLVAAFASEVGVTDFEPDEDGAYEFSIDDIAMMVMLDGKGTHLAFYAELDEPPAEGREQAYRALLEASFPRGGVAKASFSIDGESGRICLHRVELLADLDYDAFKAALEEFVNVADDWRRNLAKFPAMFATVQDAIGQDAETARSLSSGGFMRI